MHWTYTTFARESDLDQGDFLAPSSELRQILQDVHPHFADDKYLGYTVATQSCDLVRRRGGGKARYVSIAVVRSLKQVLPRLLSQVVPTIGPGIFPTSSKLEAKQFLSRVFDQNEQSMGLFYFHPEAEIGLGEPAVAFLRVKVALREQHYDALVRARAGRLDPEFRAKFGWLLGNLYSRAASPDWSDNDGGDKKVKTLIDAFLKEQIEGAGPTWVDDELADAGRAAGVVFEGRAHTEIVAELNQHRPKPRIEQIVDVVIAEADRLLVPNDFQRRAINERIDALIRERLAPLGLGEDHAAAVRQAIDSGIEAAATAAIERQRVLKTKLINSGSLRRLIK